MKILIAGSDGYLGWPLGLHLAERGHQVTGVDSLFRRRWVLEIGSDSATPILDADGRSAAWERRFRTPHDFVCGSLTDWELASRLVRDRRPDAIVHLAENPSAPWSMIDAAHAADTHVNNLVGTLNLLHAMRDFAPDCHLLKLGTMGEYGTPNVDIPEGFFEIDYRGRHDRLPFPRQAGSWYHQTKVHDSNNIAMACRIWGLRSTDVMQGVVFGTRIDAMGSDDELLSRFDFDHCFGTALNRFCALAVIGQPLTVYGKGGQTRGFLPLRDSIQCLTLALENPPAKGEYRVFNQFEEVYRVADLAGMVRRVGERSFGLSVEVRHVENPRKEAEEHYYHPDHRPLLDLGYVPTHDIEKEIELSMSDLLRCRERIASHSEVLLPDIRWDGRRSRVSYLS
jgi:UDP-sulfoquinovose synthase